jgi:hypothetical protein
MALVKLLKVSSTTGRNRQHNAAADELQMLSLQGGNLKMSGNTLSSEDVDGNVVLDPNGTGLVSIKNAYTLPGADGSANQVLATNGAGQVTFQDPGAAARICTAYTAAGAIADRDAVYISAADSVSKADATAEATSRVIGFADGAILDTQSGNICHDGVLNGFSGLTPGARYFLDPATAGAITSTVPSGDEEAIVQVGYAKSATELHIDIEFVAEVDTD